MRSLGLRLVALATLVAASVWLYRERSPHLGVAAPRPLVTIAGGNLNGLQQAFNQAGDRKRILLLLSPT
jgi:hypothetical protein